MKRILFSAALMIATVLTHGQTTDQTKPACQNIADKVLSSENKLSIGGYGEVQ
jgi:hypothetical protein